MEKEEIKGLFLEFLRSYDQEEKKLVWQGQSQRFREFWKNKILNEEENELDTGEIDEIIRILDTKARGHTKENEAVARVMVPQGVWERIFNEIKKDYRIKKLLDLIFRSEGDEIVGLINELYKINEENKNYLTGKSANVINAMVFVFDPGRYISVVSLNDRKKLIDFFGIPNGPDFGKDSVGKAIFDSNRAITKWFKGLLGEEVSSRTISDFLYQEIKNFWKKDIPDYQTLMLPLLQLLKDGRDYHFREVVNYISNLFSLTEEEKRQKLPSGYDKIVDNRVGWARTYLKKAGLLEYPQRGYLKITERGLEILRKNPPEINIKFLMQFPEFIEFRSPTKERDIILEEDLEEAETPDELISRGHETLQENLAQELLEKLRKISPDYFERVVVDLLTKMGYGKGEVTGGPGDGGIDGIIYQDPLKMDRVYLQAKRYSEKNIIGSNEILKFIGVLENKGADKGVFITTSRFHPNIDDIMTATRRKIVLIDGNKLVELMIQYNIGVSIDDDKIYEIKKIDSDYFEE